MEGKQAGRRGRQAESGRRMQKTGAGGVDKPGAAGGCDRLGDATQAGGCDSCWALRCRCRVVGVDGWEKKRVGATVSSSARSQPRPNYNPNPLGKTT